MRAGHGRPEVCRGPPDAAARFSVALAGFGTTDPRIAPLCRLPILPTASQRALGQCGSVLWSPADGNAHESADPTPCQTSLEYRPSPAQPSPGSAHLAGTGPRGLAGGARKRNSLVLGR